MRVREVATGLWWWTALHPAWTPADGGPDGWEQEVGCVYYEAPGAVVLIDPLVPMEDRDRFYRALDRDVERAGLPVRVLVTVDDHRALAGELASATAGRSASCRRASSGARRARDERVYWIPEHAALVFGDIVVGAGRRPAPPAHLDRRGALRRGGREPPPAARPSGRARVRRRTASRCSKARATRWRAWRWTV